NALHRAVGGGFQRGVDGVPGSWLVNEYREVHHADVGRRHAHGVAVELALQFGDNEVQRLGGARGARNHVYCGGASTAQIFVRQIEQALIVGIRMDGGHGAAVDAERVLNNLGDGGKTVGSAGSVGNNVVLCGVVGLVVHTEDKGGV